jgi:hypothetical protein
VSIPEEPDDAGVGVLYLLSKMSELAVSIDDDHLVLLPQLSCQRPGIRIAGVSHDCASLPCGTFLD